MQDTLLSLPEFLPLSLGSLGQSQGSRDSAGAVFSRLLCSEASAAAPNDCVDRRGLQSGVVSLSPSCVY